MTGMTRADARARKTGARRHITLRGGGWSIRFERRTALVYVALAIIGIVLALFALTLGEYTLSIPQVVQALTGHASDPLAGYFVTGVRLPRVLGALLVGAALGVSGAIFQTVSGNPLGSPDIIGFTTGSASGALIAIILLGANTIGTSIGAIIGGLLIAALVYFLSCRGGVAGFRLVLVGIGVAAALHAINSLLIVKAPLGAAQTAEQWQAGSLNGLGWARITWLAVGMLVLTPAVVWMFRGLGAMPLGDDFSKALGVRVQRMRAIVIFVGVALVALATATTGPIAFVALAAPHSIRRITRTPGIGLCGAAMMGAVLVLASDIIAQRLFAPTQLAVGVVTGSLGGCYLIVLLAMEWRRQRS